jgi:phage tail-like protein
MAAAELRVRQVVRVPELTGKSLTKARLIVENAGLRVDAVLFQESYEEKDTVLKQHPARGQMAYAGDGVTLHVARKGYMHMLPAIYRRSDPTGRNFVRDLCWILEHMFGPIEDLLDHVHNYFDPTVCPEEFLPWLASWSAMVVDLDWPVEKKRAIIRSAIELYGIRGTVRGLKKFLELFTGHEPKLLENEWPFKGFRIGTPALIGIDSVILPPVHLSRCFIVQMPVKFTNVTPEMVIRIHQIVQMERPANTHYYLRFAAEGEAQGVISPFVIGASSGIGIGTFQMTAVEPGQDDEPLEKAALGPGKKSDDDDKGSDQS